MGAAFASPQVVVAVVTAVGSGVSAILHAFRSNSSGVSSETHSDLKSQIEKLNKEIVALRLKANADEVKYESIRKFVNERKFTIGFMQDKMALMGPKGAGKSTWLWMRGYGAKPDNVVGDGTIELELSENVDYLDTVGIDFNFHGVMKFMACLIVHNHFPDTLIVCCNAHLVSQAVSVLACLGVSKFYLICLNVESAHNKGNVPEAFNSAVYDRISAKYPGVIPVYAHTHIQSLDSFEHTRKVFRNYEVRLDDYATFKSNQGLQELMRYWVCRYIYELITEYKCVVKEFLNHNGI